MIEPPCTERYARWCERSGNLFKFPSYSIVKECDIERKPSVGSVIEYDGRPHIIREISKQDGVWKILMGRSGN